MPKYVKNTRTEVDVSNTEPAINARISCGKRRGMRVGANDPEAWHCTLRIELIGAGETVDRTFDSLTDEQQEKAMEAIRFLQSLAEESVGQLGFTAEVATPRLTRI